MLRDWTVELGRTRQLCATRQTAHAIIQRAAAFTLSVHVRLSVKVG